MALGVPNGQRSGDGDVGPEPGRTHWLGPRAALGRAPAGHVEVPVPAWRSGARAWGESPETGGIIERNRRRSAPDRVVVPHGAARAADFDQLEL